MIVEFRGYYKHKCGAEGIHIISVDDVTKSPDGYLIHAPRYCQNCGKLIKRYTYVQKVQA